MSVLRTPPRPAWAAGPVRAGALLVGCAVAVAALSAIQLWVNWRGFGVEARPWALFAGELAEWLLWAGLVPVALLLDRRIQRGPWLWTLVAHALLLLGFFALSNAVMTLLGPMVDPAAAGKPFGPEFLRRSWVKLPAAVILYVLVLVAGRWLAASLRGARLEADLTEARLENLRMQLHPHFLFNAFHAVAALVREGENERAVDTLAHLGELLRRSLEIDAREIALFDEVDLLEHYLAIQRIRFSDRLRVCVDIEPPAGDALLPPLILQPLVENAIRHGLDLERGGGDVRVRGRVADGRLDVSVIDNGAGLREERVEGVGLSNTRRRLEHMYGDRYELSVRPHRPAGTEARIRIPLASRT